MENNPKKSRALVITIIIIIVLLLVGFYFFFIKKGSSTDSSPFSRIFSSLVPSTNSKDSENKNSSTKIVQAGEDIKKGDKVYISSTNSDNNPVVMKVAGNTDSFGFANQDISFGEMGNVTFETNGWSNFWSSVSGFIGGTFGNGFGNGTGNNGGEECLNGATNPPLCTINGTGECLNGATNPPLCTTGGGQGDLTPPDLIADSITPTNTTINTPTIISSLITNQGETSTGRGFLTLFKIKTSNPNQPNINEIETQTASLKKTTNLTKKNTNPNSNIELSTEIETLAGKSVVQASISYNFTSNGIYYIQACADTGSPLNPGEQIAQNTEGKNNSSTATNTTSTSTNQGNITESDENNNCSSWTAITVTPTNGSNLPDLKAGPVTPTKATINTPTKLSSVVTNDGIDSTQKSFSGLFIISPPPEETTTINGNSVSKDTLKEKIIKIFNKIVSISKAIAYGDIEIKTIVNTIQGKTNKTISVLYTFKSTGTYKIKACADKESFWGAGSILELDENNNCSSWTTITVTNTLPTGGSYQCNDTIDNDKDGKIDSKDPNCHLDGDLTKEYIAEHDSELNSPITTYQCNDTIDNDKDSKIDSKDPNCHLDGDLTKEYIAEHDSETDSPIGGDDNLCLLIEQNRLTFTDQEKAKLAELLRKFYLIAPSLKTEDDIYITYREMDNYENLIETVSSLTKQCYYETDMASYAGPKTRYGNPWYKSTERGTYVPLRLDEKSSCVAKEGTSGLMQINDNDTNIPCSLLETKLKCENEFDSTGYPTSGVQDNCQWVQKTSLIDYEAILNIW